MKTQLSYGFRKYPAPAAHKSMNGFMPEPKNVLSQSFIFLNCFRTPYGRSTPAQELPVSKADLGTERGTLRGGHRQVVGQPWLCPATVLRFLKLPVQGQFPPQVSRVSGVPVSYLTDAYCTADLFTVMLPISGDSII